MHLRLSSISSLIILASLAFILFGFYQNSFAQGQVIAQFVDSPNEGSSEDLQKAQDVRRYLETLDSLKNAPLKDQIEGWKQFLDDYPDTAFKDDISNNISNMNAVLRAQEQEEIGKEIQDKEVYEKFKSEIAAFSKDEKINKYEKFIENHEGSTIQALAIEDLNKLKSSQETAAQSPSSTVQPKETPSQTTLKLVPEGKTKDPNHALLLATLPGLAVPGMGSFYAGDTTTGVVLVVLRLAGLGMIGAGLYNDSNNMIITGAIAAGFSYAIDTVAAPISARKYNERLEEKGNKQARISPLLVPGKNGLIGISMIF